MKLRLQDVPVQGKRVLMRVDFNVPLTTNHQVADDTRIRASLPSIQYVLAAGGSLILMSHLGRPKGVDPAYSLAPCARLLESLLSVRVKMAKDVVGPSAEEEVRVLKPGEVLLLENVRFSTAEEHPEKDPSFAKKLAAFGDVYVNDAFGSAHRAHSSTAIIARYFPQRAAEGLLMQKEVEALNPLLNGSKHPFMAIIGGAKVSSKLGVLSSLRKKVDALFVGGAMASTFFKAQGVEIGDSLYEPELVAIARAFLEETSIPVMLPSDLIVADAVQVGAKRRIVDVQGGISKGWKSVDIGPRTLDAWEKELNKAEMVFWNGPVGIFEIPDFAQGTYRLARILSELSATTVVGGGDSIAAIQKIQLFHHFTHVSTGGGATLEFIEKGSLPGIDALSERN